MPQSARLTWASSTGRALGLIILGVAAAALLFGGIHKETIVAVALVGLIAAALALQKQETLSVDPMATLLMALVGLTALQLLPIPLGLVELLAPHTADSRLSAASALGNDPPGFIPISLDPESTTLCVIWMIAVTAAYLTGRFIAVRRIRAAWSLLAIPLVGAVVVGIGLVHAVLNLDDIYGVYERASAHPPFRSGALYISSFVNANHMAAFLNLGFPIALLQTTNDDLPPTQRILWACVVLILAAGIVLTLSKAGILGAVIATVFVVGRRGAKLFSWRALGGLALVAALVLVSGLGAELSKLATTSGIYNALEREMQTIGFLVTERWPWTGVGRGAFSVAHTQINDGITAYTITHAHNTPLQLLADYGVVAGGAVLLAVIYLFAQTLKSASGNPFYWSAAAGLIAVSLHNLVDFNLDILGVAFPAALILGVIRSTAGGFTMTAAAMKRGAAVAAALVVVAAVFTGPEAGPRRDSQIRDFPAQAAATYPADAYAFLRAGVAQASLPMLQHAKKLHVGEPNINLAVAALSPPETAWTEIRSALNMRWPYRVRDKAFQLIDRRAATANDVLDALPQSNDMVIKYLRWRRPPSIPLLRQTIRRYQDQPKVLLAAAELLLELKQLRLVDDVATQLMILGAKSGYRLNGKLLLRQGQMDSAYHMLMEAGDPVSLLDAAEVAVQMGNRVKALDVLGDVKIGPDLLSRYRDLRQRAKVLESGD